MPSLPAKTPTSVFGLMSFASSILLACIASTSCRDTSAPPPAMVSTTRVVGTWTGRGSQTLGFTSESGRFRVTWQTRNEDPPGTGTFRLTAHSAVSGRPIQPITDHRGIGTGSTSVEDDPRPYNLMVESSNVEWTISVEDTVATRPRQ